MRHPLGHTRFPPLIVTGRIGTCASSANRTAPALNRSSAPLGVLRAPSGKITTAPPSRNHCNDLRIAAGSLPSSASGHAPNQTKPLPTTGRNKRWEYWGVVTPTHVLALTVSSLDYAAVHEVWVLDRESGRTWGADATVVPARGVE